MDIFNDLPDDFEEVLTSPRQPFRLLDLPAELWLQILELCITRSKSIDPTWTSSALRQERIVAQPAITRTCRLLRKEGLPMFYRLNDFDSQHLGDRRCIRHWLIAIGDENRKAMRTFQINCDVDPDFWIGSFEECGIEVEVYKELDITGCPLSDRLRRVGGADYHANVHVITFL